MTDWTDTPPGLPEPAGKTEADARPPYWWTSPGRRTTMYPRCELREFPVPAPLPEDGRR